MGIARCGSRHGIGILAATHAAVVVDHGTNQDQGLQNRHWGPVRRDESQPDRNENRSTTTVCVVATMASNRHQHHGSRQRSKRQREIFTDVGYAAVNPRGVSPRGREYFSDRQTALDSVWAIALDTAKTMSPGFIDNIIEAKDLVLDKPVGGIDEPLYENKSAVLLKNSTGLNFREFRPEENLYWSGKTFIAVAVGGGTPPKAIDAVCVPAEELPTESLAVFIEPPLDQVPA